MIFQVILCSICVFSLIELPEGSPNQLWVNPGNGTLFRIRPGRVEYQYAVEFCHSVGANLAIIHSEFENEFLQELPGLSDIGNNYFIGIIWDADSGTCQWTDNSSLSYSPETFTCAANRTYMFNKGNWILGAIPKNAKRQLLCSKPDVCYHETPCKNSATCSIDVTSEHATFGCSCSSGFVGPTCSDDVNECESSPCVHGDCRDLIARYECDCTDTGYTGTNCDVDIDECDVSNTTCSTDDICINTYGSFECISCDHSSNSFPVISSALLLLAVLELFLLLFLAFRIKYLNMMRAVFCCIVGRKEHSAEIVQVHYENREMFAAAANECGSGEADVYESVHSVARTPSGLYMTLH